MTSRLLLSLSALATIAFAQDAPRPQRPAGGPYAHKVLSASSADGLTWTRDEGVRLEHASVPCAVATDGRVFLYFVDADRGPGADGESVGCAISEDGLVFKKQPLAIEGMPTDRAVDPCAMRDSAGKFRLYYFANTPGHRGDPASAEGAHSIRLALSDDGVKFKDEGVVFSREALVDPDVFEFGGKWFMYVMGRHATEIATSADGRSFTYLQDLEPARYGTVAPVKLSDGRLRLYAFPQPAGESFRSFLSSDGIHWQMEDGVRLQAAADEQITDPFVVPWKGGWKMYFKSAQRTAPAQQQQRERGPAAEARARQHGPWENDVVVYFVGGDGKVMRTHTFERAGVPTIARLADGRLIAAHQHFPADFGADFDKVAVHFSEDDGRKWSTVQVIDVAGLPEGMRFPFDPTLVPLPDGRVRLYFTGNMRGPRSTPAIHSAISTDGISYTYEPGTRFGVEGRTVIDCAAVLHQGVFHLYSPDNGAGLNPGQRPGDEPAADRPRDGIGYHATSTDGLTFTRAADVQIEGRRHWLGNAQSDGRAITFYGTGDGLWTATSEDGAAWKLSNAPQIRGGDPGAVATRDGGLMVVITGEPRRRAEPRAQNPAAPSKTNAPTKRDVLVYRMSRAGAVEQLATFEGGGVPTLARLADGRLIVAHQHFIEDGRVDHEKITVRFSSDEGATWTPPQILRVEGLPEGMPFAFDPTLVPLPDGRVRLYFTGNVRRASGHGTPAIYSAISTDGVSFTCEPGTRFDVEGRIVIDCAAVLHRGVFHLFVPDNGIGTDPSHRPADEPAANRPREGVAYHATSTDGLNFTRVADVQLEGKHRWLGNAQSDGKTITFYGTGDGLWTATSEDGATWKLTDAPQIRGGDPGAVATRDGGLMVVITGEPRRR
jgi:hypothetical protein